LSTLREGDVTAVAEVHYTLGMIRAAQGRTSEAEQAHRRSLDVLAPTGYNWVKNESMFPLAKLLIERGAVEEGRSLFEHAERWAREQKTSIWDREIDEVRSLITSKREA